MFADSYTDRVRAVRSIDDVLKPMLCSAYKRPQPYDSEPDSLLSLSSPIRAIDRSPAVLSMPIMIRAGSEGTVYSTVCVVLTDQ